MVAIDMCGKSPITGEWIYGITQKKVYFNILVLFIVDTTSVLKLVFPTVYYFCLDGYSGGCVVVIIVTVVVVVFIYLSFYLFILFFCFLFIYYLFCRLDCYSVVVIATVAFVVEVILGFQSWFYYLCHILCKCCR